MPFLTTRRLTAGLATAATAAALAGCGGSDATTTTAEDAAATTATTTASDAAGSSGSADTSGSGASSSTGSSSSSYKDGTYEAEGSYQSPGGSESIGVSLTLQDGTVTAVTVTPKATDPNGERFQGEFKDGISAVVVGKSIDSLDVSKVAGSSLTSGGFNAAVETIKADAAS